MAEVDTDAIRLLGDNIERVAGSGLERALGMLAETRGIEHSNFTSVVPALAVAYVAAVEYTEEDLKSKREHATEMQKRLATTAGNWDAAEAKSTIQQR